jgi:flagellar export protein FliJ
MQTFRKIKRVEPLIKLKKQKMDEEAVTLNLIRNEKIEVVKSMKESQKRYMAGIEELNQIRTSKLRSNLDTLEQALDFVKSQWYRAYKKVQDIELKEKQQLAALLTAERDLKSVEKLRERYTQEFQKEQKKTDQKVMDEAALRRFINRDA